jgi:hypothetical protein
MALDLSRKRFELTTKWSAKTDASLHSIFHINYNDAPQNETRYSLPGSDCPSG